MDLNLSLDYSCYVRSYKGSPRGGDIGVVTSFEDGMLAALIDASGHGLEAYAVAQKARSIILEYSNLMPDQLLLILNEELRNSIGAAASIVRIRHEQLDFSGIGNVGAYLDRKPLIVKYGVLGSRMRTPEVITRNFPKQAKFLMHTDGVSSSCVSFFDSDYSAELAVKKLVEKYGSHHDDASAFVILRKHNSA